MIDISIMIEGQNGLNWSHWKRLAAEVEEAGFAGLFRSDHAGLSLDQVVAKIAANGTALVGNAGQIADQIQAYAQAGVEELMLQWFDLDDITGLRAFADSILPRL